MTVATEEMTMADYDEVFALWKATEGMGLGASDTPERIGAFLARNPGMSFVAREDGNVVAAVLCGTDGRRGYMHHLAVAASHRRRGIGSDMVGRCMAALKQWDIVRCVLFVFAANETAIAFYRRLGWWCRDEDGLRMMSCEVK